MTDQNNTLWGLAALPGVRPFEVNKRVDLTAPNTTKVGSDTFVIFEDRTREGQVRIVRNIAPYAIRRTAVGAANESFEMILPQEGDTWFAFDAQVERASAYTMINDLNSPKDLAGPLNNDDRSVAAGISFLSLQPRVDAWRYNPMFSFIVESKKRLSVNFRLMPVSAASAISNPFTIGGAGVKRVDFAGVVVAGVQMSVTTFDLLQKQGKIH